MVCQDQSMLAIVTLIVSAVLLWIGQGVQMFLARRDRRATLKADLDMYKELPETFASRENLAASIDARIKALSVVPELEPATDEDLAKRRKRGLRITVIGFVAYAAGVVPLATASEISEATGTPGSIVRALTYGYVALMAVVVMYGARKFSAAKRLERDRATVHATSEKWRVAIDAALRGESATEPDANLRPGPPGR